MHPGHMRGVKQVVGHVQIVTGDNHAIATIESPCGITPFRHMADFCFVSQIDITHPDPDEPVAHGKGITAYLGTLWNALATGGADTAAGAVKGQAMVTTLKVIALATTQ